MRVTQDMRFGFVDENGIGTIINRRGSAHARWSIPWGLPYRELSRDYAVAARVHDSTTGQPIVIAAGIGDAGTESAGEFLSNPNYFDALVKQAPSNWPSMNMEVVIEAVVDGRQKIHVKPGIRARMFTVRWASSSNFWRQIVKHREFLKQATITAASVASTSQLNASDTLNASSATASKPIARRTLGKTGEQLSIIGFGGIVVMDEESGAVANIVAEAVDRGINYFDVAPSYGNAQERLGPALAPYRNKCFLACKTKDRMKDGSQAQLEESLRLLRTDHLDLYQFHELTEMSDLDKVLGPGGAIETMEAAKKEGKIRFIGFSAHSVETALAAMDRYNFDTVLFPVNWVLFTQANFGPQILKRAQEKKMGILALKGMAKTVWTADQQENHSQPKCWYQSASFPEEASLGLRWTLGHPITAAIPPGDERYFRLAMDVAQNYKPLEAEEEQALLNGGHGVEPIFHLGNDV